MNLIILATLSLIFVLGWYGWSVGGVRLVQTWPYESNLIAISPNGRLLANSGSYKENSWQKFGLYRLEDDTLLGPLVLWFDGYLLDYGFSPDGRYLVATYSTGGYSGSVLSYPNSITPERWHLVLWRVDDLYSKFFLPRIIQSEKKAFTALTFSPDGKFLVSGGDAIRLWKMPN